MHASSAYDYFHSNPNESIILIFRQGSTGSERVTVCLRSHRDGERRVDTGIQTPGNQLHRCAFSTVLYPWLTSPLFGWRQVTASHLSRSYGQSPFTGAHGQGFTGICKITPECLLTLQLIHTYLSPLTGFSASFLLLPLPPLWCVWFEFIGGSDEVKGDL